MKYLNILVLLFLVGFSTTTQAEKTFDCSEIIDGVFVVKDCTTMKTILNSYLIKGYATLPEVAKKELSTKNITELIDKNNDGSVMIHEDENFLSVFPPKKSMEKWSITYHNNNLAVEKNEHSEFDFVLMFGMVGMFIITIFSGFSRINTGVLIYLPFYLFFGYIKMKEANFEWTTFCLLLVVLEYAILFRRFRKQEIT